MLDFRLCLIHGLEIRCIHLIIFDLAYAQAGIIRHRVRILEGGRHLDALTEADVDGLPVFLFLELLLVLFLRDLGLGRKLRLLLEELARLRLFVFIGCAGGFCFCGCCAGLQHGYIALL